MNNIRFSVIIPTFNRGDMLCQAIEALCHQEDPGCLYEIIVADNGSTDGTHQVVETLKKNNSIPIRWVLEPRSGSHFARNTGFKAAKGEILGLIDDDIIVDPNWVKNIVKAYDNPEVSCAGSKITVRWINGEPPGWIEPYKAVLGELDLGPKLIELHYPQMINAGNFSIRKEVLLKVGGYNPCNAPGDKLVGDGECGLGSKVYRSGGRIFWVPNAASYHLQDASRITLSYMRRRARFNGMSIAYAFYRSVDGDIFKILKEIYKCFFSLVYYLRNILICVKSRKPFYGPLFKLETSLSKIFYLLRIKTNRSLRKLVEKEDWLNA